MCDTTTLLAIWLKTLLIPFGQSPGFLSKCINLPTSDASNDSKRASVVQTFFMIWANVLHKSFELLLNWFDVKILFQPSASWPEDLAASLILSIAFFALSASVEWNLIGFEFLLVYLVVIAVDLQLYHGVFFWFIWYKIWLFSGRISFCELLILHFLISRVNFLDISAMVDGVWNTLKYFWMFSASFNNSMISPTCDSFIRFSNDFKWSFDFNFREGFCKRRIGITLIALNVISVTGACLSTSSSV